MDAILEASRIINENKNMYRQFNLLERFENWGQLSKDSEVLKAYDFL